MLMPQSCLSSPNCLIFHKPRLHGTSYPSFHQVWSRPYFPNQRNQRRVRSARTGGSKIEAIAVSEKAEKKWVRTKATITVQPTLRERWLDGNWKDRSILLELVSAALDPKTGSEKETIKGRGHFVKREAQAVKFEAEFEVPSSFGEIGAILVENEHEKEMFIKDVVLNRFLTLPIRIYCNSFSCNSWVHSKHDNPDKRVFFTNKSYLPSETPEGLKRLRGKELEQLRGNGQGERKSGERVYDYDVYSDLGDPDKDIELKRPVLGGKDHPYPRRCRTGRPSCHADPLSEQRSSSSVYVPRDESFSEVKQDTFVAKAIYSIVHGLLPQLEADTLYKDLGMFPNFSAIDDLFNQGANMTHPWELILWHFFPELVKAADVIERNLFRFEIPAAMEKDKFFWLRDEEFARQTLAGLNPCCLQLVTEWPLKSKLPPRIYGPPQSAITKEIIEPEIREFCTVEEAVEQKKLFILDYHDLLLPVVEQVRQLEGTTLYGSRTLFFLTPDGTLRPLAIELTRPPMDGKPQWKQVFTPARHSTDVWLWRLAKAHALAHDSGYHQLVSHWLRTHCSTEPYIIATNRQLSAMHPIYRLLHPHFRYTMEINALAREHLINADGPIENSFSPGKYSILLSSISYDKEWQFNLQALPADLIHRGMAVEDPNAPHGLKLTIEDYPYANDGLILWDAIKGWVTEYVNRYYSDSSLVESDQELQAWWEEIRTVGHGDKKYENWWPVLKTKENLVEIVTIIMWIASGHHAAVNFGQYSYAAYFPNRPTIARKNMPTEDPSDLELELFWERPEVTLLECFPSQIQATTVMAALDILSGHSPDEEYIGQTMEPAWADDPIVKAAFEKFKGKLMELEGIIDERNVDRKMRNRNGAGILPYELLKPTSGPGVTGKGVPYSVSI